MKYKKWKPASIPGPVPSLFCSLRFLFNLDIRANLVPTQRKRKKSWRFEGKMCSVTSCLLVTQCVWLCNLTLCRTPGFHLLHYLLELLKFSHQRQPSLTRNSEKRLLTRISWLVIQVLFFLCFMFYVCFCSWTRLEFQHLGLCHGPLLALLWVFPGGLAGKESACNVGDPGLIPGVGRSPGEGIGLLLLSRYLVFCHVWILLYPGILIFTH